jgi:hypothetical protein
MSTALIAFARNGSPGWAPVPGAIQRFGGDASAIDIDADLLAAWDGVERR